MGIAEWEVSNIRKKRQIILLNLRGFKCVLVRVATRVNMMLSLSYDSAVDEKVHLHRSTPFIDTGLGSVRNRKELLNWCSAHFISGFDITGQ